MTAPSFSLLPLPLAIGLIMAPAAAAQPVLPAPAASIARTQENVVWQAEDAFGATIGRETIGIYTAGNVRGFSALAAGNARIDGLFFDQVASPSSRIRRSVSIKVGPSSLGYAFQAPTGVVDYGLIRPDGASAFSTTVSADSYRNAGVEVDAILPIAGDRLVVAGGAGISLGDFVNGATSTQTSAGLIALFRPTPDIEIQPFWTRTDTYDSTLAPLYIPAGPRLPPAVPKRRFFGQDWAEFEGAALVYGTTARLRPAPGWSIELGLFRSAFLTHRDTFVAISGIGADGVGDYLVATDPPGKTASTSGELRAIRIFAEGPRAHRLTASVRGRSRRQLFGGSDDRDFGPVRVGEEINFVEPDYVFGEQNLDRVRQFAGGLAYAGVWGGVGELSLGLSKTGYRKRVRRVGVAADETSASPVLYNGAVAADIVDGIVAYAGYSRGLEESGVAPQSATNRNEALPAIRTSQRDAGLRWKITDKLRLVAGVFDLRKPYFSRDASGLFTQLGTIRNRGVEVSLSGALTERLRLVAGGVFLDPEVTGDGVALGRVGARPVGLPRRKVDVGLDWRTPAQGVSLDARLTHQSARPATTLNSVFLSERTLVDLGGRYQFKLGAAEATLRLSVSNLFDTQGFDLYGSGTYDLIRGRVIGGYLAVDF